MEPTDFYATESEYQHLLSKYHTVSTMQLECERSRSWAYSMIAHYPAQKRMLFNVRTGKKELAIPRWYVQRYLQRVRRGNPNWYLQ